MKIRSAEKAFWRGVAVGAGSCLVSLVGAYVVIRPEDVDLALALFVGLMGIYLVKNGGFVRG